MKLVMVIILISLSSCVTLERIQENHAKKVQAKEIKIDPENKSREKPKYTDQQKMWIALFFFILISFIDYTT